MPKLSVLISMMEELSKKFLRRSFKIYENPVFEGDYDLEKEEEEMISDVTLIEEFEDEEFEDSKNEKEEIKIDENDNENCWCLSKGLWLWISLIVIGLISSFEDFDFSEYQSPVVYLTPT